jgi:hypothetical protein
MMTPAVCSGPAGYRPGRLSYSSLRSTSASVPGPTRASLAHRADGAEILRRRRDRRPTTANIAGMNGLPIVKQPLLVTLTLAVSYVALSFAVGLIRTSSDHKVCGGSGNSVCTERRRAERYGALNAWGSNNHSAGN